MSNAPARAAGSSVSANNPASLVILAAPLPLTTNAPFLNGSASGRSSGHSSSKRRIRGWRLLMLVSRFVVAATAVLFAVVGIGLWVSPDQAAVRFGLDAASTAGAVSLRADLGGLFIA